MRPPLSNNIDSMLIFALSNINLLSKIIIHFSNPLPYSTSNAQITEDPLE